MHFKARIKYLARQFLMEKFPFRLHAVVVIRAYPLAAGAFYREAIFRLCLSAVNKPFMFPA